MSRSGNEMMLELAALLGPIEKTASKCDKEGNDDDKDKAKNKDKAKKKIDKKKKKAMAMVDIVNELTILANSLDASGDFGASNMVDNTLRLIVSAIDYDDFINDYEPKSSADRLLNEIEQVEMSGEDRLQMGEDWLKTKVKELKYEIAKAEAEHNLDLKDELMGTLDSLLGDLRLLLG